MLTTRLRRQLEWHFLNFDADLRVYEDKVQDIIDSGLTVNFQHLGSRSHKGSSTESKAIRIDALEAEMNRKKDWATVVRNTFLQFRFSPEHEIMVALYIEHKDKYEVIKHFFDNGNLETTFWRWRDNWLTRALMWAKEFNLL